MKNTNVVVKKDCHSQVFLLGISRILSSLINRKKALCINNMYAGDPRQNSSGMTVLFNHGGFTLIELLVVVLIVGILAAVAVPQYQKTIKKIEYNRMLPILKAVVNAQRLYYTEHGHYATSFSDLSISFSEQLPLNTWCPTEYPATYDSRYAGGFCVAIVNTPFGIRVTPAYHAQNKDWNKSKTIAMNGYYYLFAGIYTVYANNLYCLGSRTICPGIFAMSNSYGEWYRVSSNF